MNIRKVVDTIFIGSMMAWAAFSALALLGCAVITTLFVYLNGLTGLFLVLGSAMGLFACVILLFLIGSIAKRYLGL